MPCTLTFTCVPMGASKTAGGQLDVLVVPRCDSVEQIRQLMTWGQAVLACADKFKLVVSDGTQLPLKLQTEHISIQPALWPALFGDAVVDAPGAKPRHTAVSRHGVCLTDVHTLTNDFHKFTYSRKIERTKHGPNPEFLKQLHETAIRNHGLYMKDNGDAVLVSAQPQSHRDVRTRAMLSEAVTIASNDAAVVSSVIRSRFGIAPPQFSPASSAVMATRMASGTTEKFMIRSPENAAHALARLQVHMTNSMRVARNNNEPTVKMDPCSPHLLFHANRLIATPRHDKSRAAKKIAENVLGNKPYSFNERITMLLNMPALLETLGLILHFKVDWSDKLVAGGIRLEVDSSRNSGLLPLKDYGTPVALTTMCNAQFLPQPKKRAGQAITAISDDGWIEPKDGYHVGSLQLDSSTLQIMHFANQAGLRQVSSASGETPVTVSYDEDVEHPLLPPSPHTGGLQVWQDELQNRVVDHREDARANSADSSRPLYADDLRNGFVVDILAIKPDANQPDCPALRDIAAAPNQTESDKSEWIHLCSRDEEFDINGINIKAKGVERGVKTAAARSLDPAVTLAHEVDETIFTWRLGSLVGKSELAKAGSGIRSQTPLSQPASDAQKIPWNKVPPPKIKTAGAHSPIFSWSYRVAMRPYYVTGSVVPFDSDIAAKNALPAHTFQRFELIQGPALIPVLLTDHYLDQQSPTMMFIGSKVEKDPKKGGLKIHPYSELSQRVIVPARVTPDLARRHGKSDESIKQGATVFPLPEGDLPPSIIHPAAPAPKSSGAYLPDPLCTGVWAILCDGDGKEITRKSLDFYAKKGSAWPNYTPHFVEMQSSKTDKASLETGSITTGAPGAFPFLQPRSRAFICRIPVGKTFLLYLRPKLDCSVGAVHALANATSAKGPDGKLDLELLALSDLCRPTLLRLTHATDRPINKPTALAVADSSVASGSLRVNDVSKLKIGAAADIGTTSKVALIASWEELTDDLNRLGSTSKSLTPQIAEFNFAKKPKLNKTDNTIPAQFPFSDGLYRQVKLTPRGTGRYGEIFGRDSKDPRTLDGDPVTLDLLATKAPQPPDVEYVLPNLRWDLPLKGKRTRTMGLTVIMNRPWFTSGSGEELAIITAAVKNAGDTVVDGIATSFPSPNLEDAVSAWGVLADWESALPKGAAKQLISLAPQKSPSPSLEDNPVLRNIKINGSFYSTLCYKPRYNEQDQQWYVNLSLSAPPAYGAVVRLLTARYQEHAIDGQQVSGVTMCDFVLLRPERSAMITAKGSWFHKKVQIQILGISGNRTNADDLPRHTIEVRHFERSNDRPSVFDWHAGTVIAPDKDLPKNVLWQATFDHPYLGGHLVAEEWEVFPSAEDPKKTSSMPVYSDILPL